MVAAANEEAGSFITYHEVRQGGVLSALLFIIYTNKSIKESSSKTKKNRCGIKQITTHLQIKLEAEPLSATVCGWKICRASDSKAILYYPLSSMMTPLCDNWPHPHYL